MLFHSPEFITLLFVTALAYFALPKARLYVLAIANLFFYGVTGLPWLALFVGMAWLTYYCSLHVHSLKGRWFLWLGCGANLLNLAFFKYTNFIISSLPASLTKSLLGGHALQIALPIGISFYTFQLMAYLIDVARDEVPPSPSFIDFWVFIAFFAQLIAGPIMRAKDFMPQISRTGSIRLRTDQLKYGMYELFLGLVKKVIFADTLAPMADKLFAAGGGLTTVQAWTAAGLFAFQIYFDFSAYSDMAMGIGHIFGYDMTQNFFTPYLSRGPGEFWRRWHVTLSTWIRDYVYIPLGGSRVAFPRQIFNLVLAMTLSGLWHGAAWTFVIWGLYHGLLSAGEKVYQRTVEKHLPATITKSRIYYWFQVLVWFALTLIGWVFFRAPTFGVAATMIRRMVLPTSLTASFTDLAMVGLVAGLLVLHGVERWVREREVKLHGLWRRLAPAPLRGLVYATAIMVVLVMMKLQTASFIYFKF